MASARWIWFLLGGVLTALGLFMPTGWYEPVLAVGVEADSSGIGLLLVRAAWILEGIFCFVLGASGWKFRRLGPETLPALPEVETGGLERRTARGALFAITGLAAVLRLHEMGSDLWLDEVAPLVLYRDLSFVQVAISYLASNNHLLNTELVKLSTALFGESEVSVRLPAVMFGVATVPAFYHTCREAVSRESSLAASLLLAVSYHHVFFSQNARGYSPYVLFALVSITYFSRALRHDRGRDWLVYAGASVLGLASLLISAFVLAAQGLIGLWALALVYRRGDTSVPLFARLAFVFLAIGLVALHLYGAIVPAAYAYISQNYVQASVGYSIESIEFYRTLFEGLTSGLLSSLGPEILIIGLIGAPVPFIGLASLMRRNWVVAAGLVGPAVLMVGLLVARGLSTSPRMLLLCLPAMILILWVGLDVIVQWVGERVGHPVLVRRSSRWVVIGAGCLTSFMALQFYYAHPKQDYRRSLEYVEGVRSAEGIVLVVSVAESGFRYYGSQRGVDQDVDYRYVSTYAEFEEISRGHSGPAFAVTTLHRIVQIETPQIWSDLETRWQELERFRGTLGDGDIVVWRLARDRLADQPGPIGAVRK